MSETPASPQACTKHKPVEVGSKQWYRDMRLKNLVLWITPPMPLVYLVRTDDLSMPWLPLLLTLLPPVMASVLLCFVSHALWRIEVNVAGNRERPFTEKDAKVLRRTDWCSVVIMMIALSVTSAALFLEGVVTKAEQARIESCADAVAVMAFAVGALLHVMGRIHQKAKAGYDELRMCV